MPVPSVRLLLAALAVGLLAPASPAAAQAERALAVAREVERVAAEGALWPGFNPFGVPLAVYDGGQTWLFRHPAPPEGFVVPEGVTDPSARVYAGRHPALTANSSAEVGGVLTATLLLDGAAPRPPRALAAIALHEAFHVFQRQRHPDWHGNEVDLFVYPVEDPASYALRRLEDEALVRAFAASDTAGAACWAQRALTLRDERFAGMDSAFAAYERGTELNEGLAAYVEARAAGRTSAAFPAGGFAPDEVRLRAYTTGPALAFVLDRLTPDWRPAFETGRTHALDAALRASIGVRPEAACAFSRDDVAAAEAAARGGVERLLAGRVERRQSFEARPGWRLVVEAAPGAPLWPQGFDPWNVHRVDGGVLHTRFLRLGNDAGTIEALGAEALTEAAGAHPLFNGVRRVVLAGLVEPAVTEAEGAVTVRVGEVQATFRGATVSRTTRAVVVRLAAGE